MTLKLYPNEQVDKEGADVQKVQNELMTYDLLPEEFGGDTQVAQVSAKQKTGLDELLEKILLQSEVLELKANPDRQAEGVVVEARMERGLGEYLVADLLSCGDALFSSLSSLLFRCTSRVRVYFLGPGKYVHKKKARSVSMLYLLLY